MSGKVSAFFFCRYFLNVMVTMNFANVCMNVKVSSSMELYKHIFKRFLVGDYKMIFHLPVTCLIFSPKYQRGNPSAIIATKTPAWVPKALI